VHIEVLGGLEAGGGVGSGVIYDTSGLVFTAHHVVSFSDEVTVITADGREFNGRVVGRAPERDLAIVALDDATDLVAATIAEPGTVEVGEPAIALGSPFGFQQSVTAGIISGLNRELETPVGTLTGLIQTDAPINPGNSGGPLADAEAKVIGINTAIASMSGGNDGVGFAIPIEDFASLADEVEASGGVDSPTLPAPESAPGMDQLVPGLDELLPGLDDLLNPDGTGLRRCSGRATSHRSCCNCSKSFSECRFQGRGRGTAHDDQRFPTGH
jgi:S1-C subfamily serine protease